MSTAQPRRSSRIAAAAASSITSPYVSKATVATSSRKTQRKTTSKSVSSTSRGHGAKKRKRHAPSEDNEDEQVATATFFDLPFDVLLEMLLDRSHCQFAWKRALGNVEGIPKKPEYMSEVLFSAILFCQFCFHCLRENAEFIVWHMGYRLCRKCLLQKFRTSEQLHNPKVLEPGKDEFFKTNKFMRVVPSCDVDMSSRKVVRYSQDAFLQYIQEYEALGGDQCRIIKWRKEKKVFIAMAEKARPLQGVELKAENSIYARNEIIRIVVVKESSTRLGRDWHPEIEYLHFTFASHELVDGDQEVTDAEWDRIRAPLLKHMARARTERLSRESDGIILRRCTLLDLAVKKIEPDFGGPSVAAGPAFVRPHGVDMASMPRIRRLIEKMPTSVKVLEDDVNRLVKELAPVWRADVETKLSTISRKALGKNYDASCLSHASAFFSCHGLKLSYMELLSHPVARAFGFRAKPVPTFMDGPGLDSYWRRRSEERNPVTESKAHAFYAKNFHSVPWGAEVEIEFDVKIWEHARSIFASLGYDKDVTAAEMDRANDYLVCTKCNPTDEPKDSRYRQWVRQWRAAILHACEHHESAPVRRAVAAVAAAAEKKGFNVREAHTYWCGVCRRVYHQDRHGRGHDEHVLNLYVNYSKGLHEVIVYNDEVYRYGLPRRKAAIRGSEEV
ncbi:hypothetical protein FISHEDRAFT_79087 [Fistulina hepatica ATCC 64428]|uniref:F-box domain-containing protein n=1 Tax=Fistulina hepatica ATCC 64428 TaxID=1128425 RepID=A0A0D7A1R2_9AGAR|nr:hypothetical protein FISHEDRAFT_79087 [Fistulina hepatica ATCC 64428]